MKKQLGFVFALLLSLVLVACPPVPSKYTLEVAGGSYVQQTSAGGNTTTIGTNVFVKIRTRDGLFPSLSATVTLIGPTNWNTGQPVFFTYPAGSSWVTAPQAKIPLLLGKYTVRVSIDGLQLESSFQTNQLDTPLGLTTITASYLENSDSQKVQVNWSPIQGAVGYYTRVLDGSINQIVSNTIYTLSTSAQIPVDVLNPSRAYFVIVVATTVDTVVNDPITPTLFNASDSLMGLSLSTQTKMNQHTVWQRPSILHKY